MPTPPSLSSAGALLVLAAPVALSASIGWYGSDATCAEANIVEVPHVVWGGACWGGSAQYGLGVKWVNGVSNGNTVEYSLPHLGNLSIWDAYALISCAPGTVTLGTWYQPAQHPQYCSGPPSQTLTLPLGVCKFDALDNAYKKLLDDSCGLPSDSTFFFFDMFYNSPSCDPSALIHSGSYWSGSAGQAPPLNPGSAPPQCQYAEVPSYYGSYQYWQGSGRDRAKVTNSPFQGGQCECP